MPCIIERNQDGQIKSVLNEKTNTPSLLFKKIASHPHIKDNETAYDVMSNTFTESFKDNFKDGTTYMGGEPKMFFKSGKGKILSSFTRALKDSDIGDVEMGAVSGDDEFIPLHSISAQDDVTTNPGFINKYIKDNIIADEKKQMPDGSFRLQGRGAQDLTAIINSVVLETESSLNVGRDRIKTYPDGTFELLEEPALNLTLKNGGTKVFNVADIKQKLKEGKYNELNNQIDGFPSVVFNIFRQENELFSKDVLPEYSPEEENTLRNHLLNILSSVGISVTTITNYVKNYKIRNGIDLSVEAIADVANGVVAFADGKVSLENLAEETAHIIVEATTNQDQINSLLNEVEGTDEWNEYNELYYEKYKELYSGDDLENAVRREILGKILYKSIISNFSSSNLKNQGLFPRIMDVLNKFIQTVQSYFIPSTRIKLDSYIKQATQMVLSKNATANLDVDTLYRSNIALYSVNNNQAIKETERVNKQLLVKLMEIKQTLERRLLTLSKIKDPGVQKLKSEIRKLSDAIEDNNTIYAIQAIVFSNDSQIKELKVALERYKKKTLSPTNKTAFLNEKDQATYNYLKNTSVAQLTALKGILRNLDKNETKRNSLLSQVEQQLKDISDIEGDAFVQSGRDFDIIFERNVLEYGMAKEDKEKLRAMFETEQKDISSFQQWFGQLEHSSNPILGLLGKIINGNYHKARLKTLEIINPVLAKANKEGWNMAKMDGIIEKDKDGKLTGWLISDIKWAEFTADEKKMREDALKSVLTDEQKDSNITESDLTDEQFEAYTRIKEEWYAENTERIFTNEYYQQREQRYVDAGVGRDLREILKHFSQRRATILDTYRKGGQIDYASISSEDLDGLKRIALDRKALKSSYDALTGELKDGNELEIAQQLQNLDSLTFDKSNIKVVKDSFYETLKKVESEQGNLAAYDWLRANGGIVFSDAFWDGLKNQSSSLTEKMRDIAERIENEDESEKLFTRADELEELLNSKNQILKQYATPNAPSEIDVEVMPEVVKQNILTKENEIQQILQDVNTLMDKYGENTITIPTTETTVNEAYYKELQDSDLDEIQFIQSHLTEYNKKRVNAFAIRMEKIANNSSRDYVEPSFLRWLGVSDVSEVRTLIAEKGIEELTVDYGKSKIAGYFKRFAPAGFDNILLSLENGASVVQLVDNINNGMFPNLSISTRFEWVEDEISEGFLNPNYDKNAKAGLRQPKLSKYRNEAYSPSAQQAEMLKTFKDMMSTALRNFGEEESRNENRLPMIGAQLYEKISRASVAQGKDWIKDIIYNRVDEMAYGARVDNQDVVDIGDMKIIPKQYLNDLEDIQTISKDLLYSYSAIVHASQMYVERQNTVEDINVLQDKLLSRPFEKGKSPDASNTMKMFRGFVDNYMYGIKLSHKKIITLPNGKEIDITRWIQAIDRWVRKVGTGFSPVIAATSALVSNLQGAIEVSVGQYTSKTSAGWALKEMAKLMPEYSLDMGRTDRKSKMYILGETFGIHDYNNKTKSAGYNKILRAATDLPYAFMTVMSAPHLNTTMLSVLDDFRLVNGTFITLNEFTGTSEEWKKLKPNSLYNSLTIENGRAVMKPEIETQLGSELSDAVIQRAALKIDRINGYIDSTISDTDRSNASRHYLWNLTLGFRGYLTLLIQRKTKRNHFNFVHGTEEEGHYRSAGAFIQKFLALNKEEKLQNFVSTIRKTYHQLSENEQKNLKRTFIEFGVFTTMLGLGMAIANYDDDERNKNKWGIHLMAFLYYRTANEIGSSQAPFSILNALDVVKTPVVIMNNIDKLTTMKNLNPNKIIESGAYKGHSFFTRTLIKQTYLKNWYQLIDIKNVSDYYRLNNSEVLVSMQKKSKEEREEENSYKDNVNYSDIIRRN